MLSDPDPAGFQTGEQPPDLAHNEWLLSIAESLKIQAEADRRSRRGVASRRTAATGTEARARALESYLRDSHKFQLFAPAWTSSTRKLDPVEDFLVNRKEGHCEYFASALALLLRSIDIPTRMVNGFKGGDWNEITPDHERAAEARA